MPLDFVGDAIVLSGLTGSRLKCDVIGKYYPFWWRITSGGSGRGYNFQTAIVELDAATGEVYIEDTNETVLGSAGHALELKAETSQTEELKIVLIEKNRDCCVHLKKVIERRWPDISVKEAEDSTSGSSGVYLLNMELEDALLRIKDINLGNALFFFDPLLSVEYKTLEQVTKERIKSFYKTGTEFFIFVFTSDWFFGRNDLTPLPSSSKESEWEEGEKKTILQADSLFGSTNWRRHVLNNRSIEDRERTLIELYKERLHRWFRYILPMPFNPKRNQIFHLILCSNYEIGVRRTRDYYSSITNNPKFSPNNDDAFDKFQKLHPELSRGLEGVKRPLQWRILWTIIRQHEDGICDCECRDLQEIVPEPVKRQYLLDWLEKKGYLTPLNIENAWNVTIRMYKLNWVLLKERLKIDPPSELKPLLARDSDK